MTETTHVKEAPRVSEEDSSTKADPTTESDELALAIFASAVTTAQNRNPGDRFNIEIPGIFMSTNVRQLARSLRILSDKNEHPEIHFHLVIEAWTVSFDRR
ncbi:MAG: hypothetical protein V4611_04025 [Patescibacteria group bacterium]